MEKGAHKFDFVTKQVKLDSCLPHYLRLM